MVKKNLHIFLLMFLIFSCGQDDHNEILQQVFILENQTDKAITLETYPEGALSPFINLVLEGGEIFQFDTTTNQRDSDAVIWGQFFKGDSAVIIFEDGKLLNYLCKDLTSCSSDRNFYNDQFRKIEVFTIENGRKVIETYTITQSDYLNAQ